MLIEKIDPGLCGRRSLEWEDEDDYLDLEDDGDEEFDDDEDDE